MELKPETREAGALRGGTSYRLLKNALLDCMVNPFDIGATHLAS